MRSFPCCTSSSGTIRNTPSTGTTVDLTSKTSTRHGIFAHRPLRHGFALLIGIQVLLGLYTHLRYYGYSDNYPADDGTSSIATSSNILGITSSNINTKNNNRNTKSTSTTNQIPPSSTINHNHDILDATECNQSSSAGSLIRRIVIFYNIYIHPNDTNPFHIVQEQIGTIGSSYAAQWHVLQQQQQQQQRTHNSISPEVLTIYYITTGNQSQWNHTYMNGEICSKQLYPLNCIHQKHYTYGFEEVTLQSLYEYCTPTSTTTTTPTRTITLSRRRNFWTMKNNSTNHRSSTKTTQSNDHYHHIVIYLHNKGSYSEKNTYKASYNSNWRQHLTKAVVSKECIDHLLLSSQDDDNPPEVELVTTNSLDDHHHRPQQQHHHQQLKCSMCSLQFLPLHSMNHAGNIFGAQCSYIQKLISPLHYMTMPEQIWEYRPKDNLLNVLYLPNRGYDMIGRGRYAMEEWSCSHPSLIPCDLSMSNDVRHWFKAPHKVLHSPTHLYQFHWWGGIQRYNFSHPPGAFNMLRINQRTMLLGQPALRLREEHLLPGILYKYHMIYPGEFPNNHSWIWHYYPDGLYWRNKVKQYQNGLFALEHVWNEIPIQPNST